MRPLRLRVENLTAFRGEQPVLDLGEYELFAISGATGSGKTSLLDAILIALYGEVPRTSSNLKEMISQGRDRMSVRLDFGVGGVEFRVTRAVYANTRPTQAILERLGKGGETTPVADGVTAVGSEIQRLLGLNYDAFTQAVVLPQGRFDQFLRSKPRERNDILKELLRLQVYERMREKAEGESKLSDAAVRMLTQMLEQTYADATREALTAVTQELTETRKETVALTKRVEGLASSVETLHSRVGQVRDLVEARKTIAGLELRREAIEKDEARLVVARRAGAVVPQLESGERARAEADKAQAAASECEEKAHQASEEQTKAKARLAIATKAGARIPDLEGRIEALGRAVALAPPIAGARRRVDQAREREKKQDTEATKATQAAIAAKEKVGRAQGEARVCEEEERTARATLEAAQDARQEAQAAREAGIRTNAIAHLRHGLKPSDSCPICERPLDSTPRKIAGFDETRLTENLNAAEAAVLRSRDAHETSRSRVESARRAEDRSLADVEATANSSAAATASLEQASVELEAALGEISALEAQLMQLTSEADPSTAQTTLRREKERLSKELVEAQKIEATAAATLAAARAAAGAATVRTKDASAAAQEEERRAAKALADAGFGTSKGARGALLAESEQAVLAESVETWKRNLYSASERVRTLEGTLDKEDKATEALKTLVLQFETAQRDLTQCRQERDVRLQAESRLEQKRRDVEERLNQAEQKRKELEEARARGGPLRQLALDLRSNHFQAYLLEETFRELVAGASVRLMKLSGRYGFEYEKDAFFVIDQDNASERRRVETLSGGETFLASLALALELSQQVQRSAGAVDIECLFIDEGFGSLDSETLDVVADAIESLPTAGRMVGIVTHLPELTARLPACIRVEKGPDGSRVTLRAT